MSLSRNDLIVQSAQDYMRNALYVLRGFDPNEVVMLDAFDYVWVDEHKNGLDNEYVATGFNFDDGGRNLEMGSSLRTRSIKLEILIFATSPDRGENLNGHISSLWQDSPMLLPVLDYRQPQSAGTYPAFPQIDYCVVEDARGMRLVHPNPDPWQRNTWQVVVDLNDEFYADQW